MENIPKNEFKIICKSSDPLHIKWEFLLVGLIQFGIELFSNKIQNSNHKLTSIFEILESFLLPHQIRTIHLIPTGPGIHLNVH